MEDLLLSPDYFSFELDKSIKRYEDSYVIAERHDNGTVTITGKPIKPVFIYAEEI